MVLKPGREAEAEAIFRKWELDFAVIGEVTDTGRMVLEFNGEVVVRHPARPAGRRSALYERPYAIPESARAASRHPRKHRHRRGPAEADGLAQPREPALDLAAVRSVGRRRHRAAPRRRRGGGARPRLQQGAGDHHRLHAALLLCRSVRGRKAGGRRSLSQPVRGRRQAARDHQLPQFRQPSAARDHGPVRRLPHRHERSLPRPRLPGRERQRLALQRDQERRRHQPRHPPDAGDRRRSGCSTDWEKSATIGFKAQGENLRSARPLDGPRRPVAVAGSLPRPPRRAAAAGRPRRRTAARRARPAAHRRRPSDCGARRQPTAVRSSPSRKWRSQARSVCE